MEEGADAPSEPPWYLVVSSQWRRELTLPRRSRRRHSLPKSPTAAMEEGADAPSEPYLSRRSSPAPLSEELPQWRRELTLPRSGDLGVANAEGRLDAAAMEEGADAPSERLRGSGHMISLAYPAAMEEGADAPSERDNCWANTWRHVERRNGGGS